MRRLLWILLLACFASSCVMVESRHPVSGPLNAHIDKDLYGIWYMRQKKKHLYMHILPLPGKLAQVLMIEYDKKGTKTKTHRLHLSKVGKLKIINVWGKKKGKKRGPYMLVKYQIKRGHLRLSFLRNSAIQKAIESGQLKGKVSRDKQKRVVGIQIHETPKKLAAFFKRAGPKYFHQPDKPFRRLATYPPFK